MVDLNLGHHNIIESIVNQKEMAGHNQANHLFLRICESVWDR